MKRRDVTDRPASGIGDDVRDIASASGTREPPTWPDGRVKLPEVLRRWVDGHCEGGMDDDPEMCDEHHNVVSVALWSLIYRQGYPPEDQAVLDTIAEFANPSQRDSDIDREEA